MPPGSPPRTAESGAGTRAVHAALLLALAACASPPPPRPFAPPPLELGVHHFAGSVLTGPQPGVEVPEVAASDALALRFRVLYGERPRESELAPVGARAQLVLGARGGRPLQPTAALATAAGVGTGPSGAAFARAFGSGAFGTARLVETFDAALPPGVTTAVFARTIAPVETSERGLVQRRISVQVSRDAAEAPLQVALLTEDVASFETAATDGEAVPREALQQELVLLDDAPEIDGAPLVLMLASRFDPAPDRAFVVEIAATTPDPADEAHRDRVARCARQLAAARAEAAAAARWMPPAEAQARAMETALRALAHARQARPALTFLAASSDDAPLALDLALMADEQTLAAWAESIRAERARDPEAPLAWQLERTAYRLLAARLDDDELALELRALLQQHAGEAGRFPGALSAVLAPCDGRAALQAALVAENLAFLAGSDPSARIRAYDWLAARGAAPEGYDPLAAREVRREALARAASAAEAQAAKEAEARAAPGRGEPR